MHKTFSKNEVDAVAGEVLASLAKGSGATVVALSGDLGAGKTTLTQAIARALGIRESLVSPTFVIMKLYAIPQNGEASSYKQLVHIDAYRLESASELERLGWKELAADPQNLILIEWPEKVPGAIPADAHKLDLSHVNEGERKIAFF